MRKSFLRMLVLLLIVSMLPLPVFAANTDAGAEPYEAARQTTEKPQKSGLPQVYVTVTDAGHSAAGLTKDDGYVGCVVEIYDPSGEYATVSREGKIKVRGNTTANGAKKPFNIKLTEKTNLLGMGKAKKWSLLANMYDKSLMRNKLVFDFAADIGMDYVSEARTVDVWLDGKYNGTYTFCEPVEIGSSRVDIDDSNGEFIFEREKSRYEADATYLVTSRYGLRFVFDDPDEPTAEQVAALKAKLAAVEDAIATNDLETMRQYIDIDSFVDMYIVEEYFKDVDADYSSAKYYFKNGLLYAGPVWDFDLAAGNCSVSDYYDYNNCGTTGNSFEGFYANNAIWFRYLLKNQDFYQKLRLRYAELQPVIVNLYAENELGISRMDAFLAECGESISENWKIWDVASKDSSAERIPNKTYEANVEYLRNWLSSRNRWMLERYDLQHGIIVSADELGTVSLDSRNAVTGQTVRFCVTPMCDAAGGIRAELTELRLISDNTEIPATLEDKTMLDDGTECLIYSFQMPDGDVTITASFALSEVGEAVRAVEALIEAIGDVDENAQEAITAAREAYEALTMGQKAFVSNYRLLEDAEHAYAVLLQEKAAAATQQAAKLAADAAAAAERAKNLTGELQKQSDLDAAAAEEAKAAAASALEAATEAKTHAESAQNAARTAQNAAEQGELHAASAAVSASESAIAAAEQCTAIADTKLELAQMLLQAAQAKADADQAALTGTRYNALLKIAVLRREHPEKTAELDAAEKAVRAATTAEQIAETLRDLDRIFVESATVRMFCDVAPNAWYYDYVNRMVDAKLMNGISATEFGAEQELTRAQLVTILYRASGMPSVKQKSHPFSDVAPDAWYAAAVTWAYGEGIVNGVSETAFAPDEPIVREQLAKILYQYSGCPKANRDAMSNFTDARNVSAYARNAMAWAVDTELLNGTTKTTLKPQASATRAQICAVLTRLLLGSSASAGR